MILVKPKNGEWTIDNRFTCSNQFSLANTAPSERYEARAGIKWDENARTVTIEPFAITSSISEKESDKLAWLERNLNSLENYIAKKFKVTATGRPSKKAIYVRFCLGQKRYEFFRANLGYRVWSYTYVYKVL